MDYKELQKIADEHHLGRIHFQYNIAQNTGKAFEVGYVAINKRLVLFCKRASNSSPDAFYLCNEFRELEK
jgi:hypothetical protein